MRSYSNRPPELYIAPNKPNAPAGEIKQATTSPTDEFFAYNWIDPPIVTFKARDGVEVPARLYKPRNGRKAAPPCCLFMARVIYRTSTNGGAVITANTCSITC